MTDEAIQMPPTLFDELRARAAQFIEKAKTAERRGDADGAIALYDDALSLMEDEGDSPMAADAIRWKGWVLGERGDTSAAFRFFNRSLAMAERLDYINGQAHALNCLGTIAQRRGELKNAEQLYRQAGHHAEASADRTLFGMVEMNRGVIAASLGEWDTGLVRLRLGLAAFESIGDRKRASYAYNNIGIQYASRKHYARAVESFEFALGIAYEREDMVVEATVELNLADVRIRQGELDSAGRSVARALKIAEIRRDTLRIAEALRLKARIERLRGQLAAAVETLRQARYNAREGEDAILQLELLTELGELCREQGDAERTKEVLREALAGFADLGAMRRAEAIAEELAAL
ncbi:MAG: tetratricopeptide repeat protein [Gemmatimonadaceae bacterium]